MLPVMLTACSLHISQYLSGVSGRGVPQVRHSNCTNAPVQWVGGMRM